MGLVLLFGFGFVLDLFVGFGIRGGFWYLGLLGFGACGSWLEVLEGVGFRVLRFRD